MKNKNMSVKYNQSRSANKGVKVGRPRSRLYPSLTNGRISEPGEFFGKKNIVLYFYPKDNTAGCTAEACSFRDSYEVFQEAGAEVIGISSDSEKTHQQFANKNKLPFILLSDLGGVVRKFYGVPSTFGLLPGRVTYIIDKKGIVRHIFSSQFAPQMHVTEALKVLNELNAEEKSKDQA